MELLSCIICALKAITFILVEGGIERLDTHTPRRRQHEDGDRDWNGAYVNEVDEGVRFCVFSNELTYLGMNETGLATIVFSFFVLYIQVLANIALR